MCGIHDSFRVLVIAGNPCSHHAFSSTAFCGGCNDGKLLLRRDRFKYLI